MQGKIDSSFTTEQRDLFTSGLVAEIGVNAYAVWGAIKHYADYDTGHAFPGMRTLGEKLGLSAATVKRAIDVLVNAKMLRIVNSHSRRKGQTYIARERVSVRFGNVLICTIVVDYVPLKMRGQIKQLEEAFSLGEKNNDLYAEVEILPGPGFEWDAEKGVLCAKIEAKDLPHSPPPDEAASFIGGEFLKKAAPNIAARLGSNSNKAED